MPALRLYGSHSEHNLQTTNQRQTPLLLGKSFPGLHDSFLTVLTRSISSCWLIHSLLTKKDFSAFLHPSCKAGDTLRCLRSPWEARGLCLWVISPGYGGASTVPEPLPYTSPCGQDRHGYQQLRDSWPCTGAENKDSASDWAGSNTNFVLCDRTFLVLIHPVWNWDNNAFLIRLLWN